MKAHRRHCSGFYICDCPDTQPPPQPVAEDSRSLEDRVVDEICFHFDIGSPSLLRSIIKGALRPSPVDAGEADTDLMRIALIEANRDKAHLERTLSRAQSTLRLAYQWHLGNTHSETVNTRLCIPDQIRLGRELAENWTKTNGKPEPLATAGVSDGERVKIAIEALEHIYQEKWPRDGEVQKIAGDALRAMTAANQPEA